MTQRAEGNLIGALKKESNLTIKQALNTVVITAPLASASNPQPLCQGHGKRVGRALKSWLTIRLVMVSR